MAVFKRIDFKVIKKNKEKERDNEVSKYRTVYFIFFRKYYISQLECCVTR